MIKLLIGYDGSMCSGEAIEDLRLAGLPSDNVEVLVISVADVLPDLPGTDYPTLYPDAAARAQAQIEDAMGEAGGFAHAGRAHVARLFPGWQVRSEVVANSPYWGLVSKAEQWGADLLLVGSHGRSAVGRLVFGSISQNAVHYAGCNVRIGRCRADRLFPAPSSTAEAARGVRVMLGWDDSPDAEMAGTAIAHRQWPPGSHAQILTALDSRLVTRLPGGIERLVQRARTMADHLRAAGLSIDEPIMRDGDPKRVLADEASAWQADCIFVGAKGLSRIERVLLGSVSSTIAARAHCSVEVVRWHRSPA